MAKLHVDYVASLLRIIPEPWGEWINVIDNSF
jgi:hypothetical protein